MQLPLLIALLAERHIQLSLKDKQLIFNAPAGRISPSLLRTIDTHRNELIIWIAERDTTLCNLPLSRFSKVLKQEAITVPATITQQKLWQQSQSAHTQYAGNAQLKLPILGVLDLVLMNHCLNALVQRHAALRTVFSVNEAGNLVQSIRPLVKAKISLHSVGEAGITNAEFDREVERIGRFQGQVKLDLERGPLFQMRLVQAPEEGPNKNGCQTLLFLVHRSIADERAQCVLLQEWLSLYKGKNLPAVRVSSVDCALWEQEWLATDEYARCLSYWQTTLSHRPPALGLPCDRSRTPITGSRGAWKKCVFSKALSKKLRRFSEQENVSVHTVLLAALNVLLMRYTGQSDITLATQMNDDRGSVLNSVVASRPNTVVLRGQFSLDNTFKTLLHDLNQQLGEALEHQPVTYSALENLVREAGSPESVPQCQVPLCQVMLELKPQWPKGEAARPEVVCMEMAEFDIAFRLRSLKERFEGHIEYATDLFDDATIEQFSRHYLRLLAAVVKQAYTPLSEIPLLTTVENRRIVRYWNQTHTSYPHLRCVHQLFEDQVKETPEAVAVSLRGEHLTYKQLNCKSNQLAHYLIAKGLVPEQIVALYLERGFNCVVAILGVIKAGGAYVPIDPSEPAVRVEPMMKDAAARIMITESCRREFVHCDEVIELDTEWPLIACYEMADPECTVKPENLIYTLYTSGSGGTPKGIMVSHKSVVNSLIDLKKRYELKPNHKVLQHSPYTFDLSVFELLGTLCSGAELDVLPPDIHQDSDSLAIHLRERAITSLFLVPSTLNALLESKLSETFPDLKQVMCIGETLPLALHNKFLSRYPNTHLHNLYGPTETTVAVSAWPCHDLLPGNTVPIGRPMNNVQMYILDRYLSAVPVGVVGELYVGGAALARGYLGQPALSAECFVPDSFTPTAGGRLYKTGDLASFKPDGNIQFVGRIDRQVKILGFRVELGEIEKVFVALSNVREAAVIFDETLVAYLVLEASVGKDASVFRRVAKAVLPVYMVPSVFIFLECLPLNANGILDQRALVASKKRTRLMNQLEYWTKTLSGAPALLTLPIDRSRPAVQNYQLGRCPIALSPELIQNLYRLGKTENQNLSILFFVGFNILLSHCSGQRDICVGTPATNNPSQVDEDECANTLVIRSTIDETDTVKSLTKRVKETVLGAFENGDVPFDNILETLQTEHNLSYSPLFQAMFKFQSFEAPEYEIDGMDMGAINAGDGIAKCDISLDLVEWSEGVDGVLEYNCELFDRSTIERMVGYYQILLEGMVGDSSAEVLTLPILKGAARRETLIDWNEAELTKPRTQGELVN